MSRSLQLRGGDLTVSGARMGEVAGGQKLVQDLRCAILERRGHDDMHPTFGSLLDGGIDEHGREVATLIGQANWDRVALRVQAEIKRLASEHQRRQIARAEADRLSYGESTLSNSELLLDIRGINILQAADVMFVRVELHTGSDISIPIDVPVSF